MAKGSTMAMILAEPGPLRDSLRAFLLTLPQIEAVDLVDDALSALSVVIEHRPALVLVDAGLSGNGGLTALRQIKAEGLQSRCLVLADNAQQIRHAQAIGADVALLKGFPAAKLFEIVERLLPEQKEVDNA